MLMCSNHIDLSHYCLSSYSLTPLREKCPYWELFWSTFSRIQTEYWEILRISPYSVWMRENADQNNSEYGQFLSNAHLTADWIVSYFLLMSFVIFLFSGLVTDKFFFLNSSNKRYVADKSNKGEDSKKAQ